MVLVVLQEQAQLALVGPLDQQEQVLQAPVAPVARLACLSQDLVDPVDLVAQWENQESALLDHQAHQVQVDLLELVQVVHQDLVVRQERVLLDPLDRLALQVLGQQVPVVLRAQQGYQ